MSDWLPSLNALRAFEATARHLNFRAAAEELHVTPAAVKQLVRGLEAALDEPLVVRHGRGLRLTDAGFAGLADLTDAFNGLSRGVARMRQARQRNVLTITVEPSFAANWLVKRLDGFRRLHPGVDLLVDSSAQTRDLQRGQFDLAIRHGVGRYPALQAVRLFENRIFAVCCPALADEPPGLAGPRDLLRHNLIHDTSPHTSDWPDWYEWLTAVGVEGVSAQSVGLHVSDHTLELHAAIAGHGVALSCRPLVQDALDAGLLVRPLPDEVAIRYGYDLLLADDADPNVAAFRDWIVAEAARSAGSG